MSLDNAKQELRQILELPDPQQVERLESTSLELLQTFPGLLMRREFEGHAELSASVKAVLGQRIEKEERKRDIRNGKILWATVATLLVAALTLLSTLRH